MVRAKSFARSTRSWLLFAALTVDSPDIAAQAIARLYSPQPPAGSAYVRVVNPAGIPLYVRISLSAPADQLSAVQISSVYRIVPGGRRLSLELNGQPANVEIVPLPNKFTTLIARPAGRGYVWQAIVEDTTPIDGLRADLRFYNLIDGCRGSLNIVDGPRVFDSLPANTDQRRSINPVETNLYGECDKIRSASWVLPSLQPGSHYSLFLVGTLEHPVLTGQLDETEPYREPLH